MIIYILKLKGVVFRSFPILPKLPTKMFYKKSENISNLEKVESFNMKNSLRI